MSKKIIEKEIVIPVVVLLLMGILVQPVLAKHDPKASFQGLGEMPNSTAAGTKAFGISGDGNISVGAGWISSTAQEAFQWSVNSGYHLLGSLGSSSDARAASFNGSVVVRCIY